MSPTMLGVTRVRADPAPFYLRRFMLCIWRVTPSGWGSSRGTWRPPTTPWSPRPAPRSGSGTPRSAGSTTTSWRRWTPSPDWTSSPARRRPSSRQLYYRVYVGCLDADDFALVSGWFIGLRQPITAREMTGHCYKAAPPTPGTLETEETRSARGTDGQCRHTWPLPWLPECWPPNCFI